MPLVLPPGVGEKQVQTSSGLAGRQFMPAAELAAGIARLRAAEGGQDRANQLLRAYAPSISDTDLAKYGLERPDAPRRSLLSRAGGLLGSVVDIIDRPSQGVLRTLGGLTGGTGENPIEGLVGGLTGRGDRVSFQESLFGDDVVTGLAGGAINLAGTIATDPLTFVSFGGGQLARQGLRRTSAVIGQEGAERLARQGLKALTEREAALLTKEFGEEGVQALARTIRGGAQLNIPFRPTATRTLVPGEVVRSPLRRAGVLDDVRGAARRGAVAGEGRRTLQSAVRELPGLDTLREGFQTRTELIKAYGRAVADEIGQVGTRTAARMGLSTNETINRLKTIADSIVIDDPDLRASVMQRFTRALDTNDVPAEVLRLRKEGMTDAAEALLKLDGELATAERGFRRVGDPRFVRQTEGAITPQRTETPLEAAGLGRPAEQALPQEDLFGQVGTTAADAIDITRGPISTVRGQIPGQGALDLTGNVSRLPRIQTSKGRKALKQSGRATQEDFERLVREGGDVFELNAQARQLEGLQQAENILESDPFRLVAIQVAESNNAVGLAQMADDLARVALDPETNNPTVLVGNSEAIRQQARTLDYVEAQLGNNTVWVPPALKPEITRFNTVVFKDPGSVASFQRSVDEWQAIWKLQATSALPFSLGFHARNLTGNLFNNWLAGGIGLKEYREATRLQKVISEAQRETMRLAAETTPAVRRGVEDIAERRARTAAMVAPESYSAPIGPRPPEFRGQSQLTPREADELRSLEITLQTEAIPLEDGRVRRTALRPSEQQRLRELRARDAGVNLETGERIGELVPQGNLPAVAFDRPALRGRPVPEAEAVAARAAAAEDAAIESVMDGPLFERALKSMGVPEADQKLILQMRDNGVLTAGFYKTDLHEDALRGLPTSQRQSQARQVIDNFEDSWMVRYGTAMGDYLESNARMAHFIGKLNQGMDPMSAILSVKEHLFDYSDLTQFERRVLRRIMPFYTFMRKNTPLQFRNVIAQPRKLVAGQRINEAVAGVADDEDFLQGRALPDWILRQGDVPVAKGMINELFGGNDEVLTTFGIEFPTSGAMEALEPWIQIAAVSPGLNRIIPDSLTPEQRSEGFRAVLNLPGGGVTELFKIIAEQGFEQDLFTGAPVDDSQLLKQLAELSPFTSQGNRTFNSLVTVLSPGTEGAEEARARTALVREILGLNVNAVDPQRERGEMFRRLDVIEGELARLRAQGKDVPTISELRDAGIIPPLQRLGR